jgi:S-sulfo-L-cysteine synthase (O-acetyl-L-serine-dependent)
MRQRGNVVLGQARGQQPGRLGQGPTGAVHDPCAPRSAATSSRATRLIEATSGNTGIALAMAAAIKGYRMVLIMPEDLSIERAQTMKAFGAELILTPKSGGMESMRGTWPGKHAGRGPGPGAGPVCQHADNPRIHYETTGPEIWQDTDGRVTHFVSAMGTTGTITGRLALPQGKEPGHSHRGRAAQRGLAHSRHSQVASRSILPKIYDPSHVDELVLCEPARR